MYKCDKCGFETESRNKYVAHKAHFNHDVVCTECGEIIGAYKRLYDHYLKHFDEITAGLKITGLTEVPKCPECGKDVGFDRYRLKFNKFCSKHCQVRHLSLEMLKNGTHPWDFNENSSKEHIEKVKSNRLKQITDLTNSHSSKIELDFYNKVKSLYPSAINNYYVKSGIPQKNYYFLDIYIPEFKLDIEIDGPFHAQQVELDRLRDADLKSKDIKVHRIIANSARKYTVEMIQNLIKSLIEG